MTALVRADAARLPLADGSVDLIVTSPPYFALRSYTDGGEHYDGQIGSEPTPQEFLEALWAVTAECKRVLKPSGSMFVNLGDKYAGSGGHNNSNLEGNTSRAKATPTAGAARRSAPDRYNQAAIGGARPKSLMGLPWRYAIGCIDQLDLILRAEIVWSKPNGLPESVTDRVRRSHEQWFHFTREGRYYSGVDEIREPYSPYAHDPGDAAWGDASYDTWGTDGTQSLSHQPGTRTPPHPLGKLPGSVWSIPAEPLTVPDHLGVDHFAAFPQEWPRRLILGWSPPGICVECGEGRRPVGQVAAIDDRRGRVQGRAGDSLAKAHGPDGRSGERYSASVVSQGYGCACGDAPSAPTRPAVVLDPFAGTGTTVMVARALGRHGVGVDLSGDYLRLARWRIWESGAARKTIERTNRERQGALFGGAA
ncbi:MAG TPA: site-specific DNA-methyltransferase [Nitriliruptorales bacterium]